MSKSQTISTSAETPYAEVGEAMIWVKVGDKFRLQVRGSDPPLYRRINGGRQPTLKVGAVESLLYHVAHEGGYCVLSPTGQFLPMEKFPEGTEIAVVSYHMSLEDFNWWRDQFS